MILQTLKPIFRLCFPSSIKIKSFSAYTTLMKMLQTHAEDDYLSLLGDHVLSTFSKANLNDIIYLALCLSNTKLKDKRLSEVARVLLNRVGEMNAFQYSTTLLALSNLYKDKAIHLTLSQREYLILPIIDEKIGLEELPELITGIP